MAAARLQVIPSFLKKLIEKTVFLVPVRTYEKYIVSKYYYIARHDHKMCFLPICGNYIILMGDFEELL